VDAIQGSVTASSEAGTGVAVWPFTATHFSFLPLSTSTSLFSASSSSEVTLSSVSASTPVVVSDSELELEDDDSEVEVVVSVVAATGAVSVDVVSTPGVEVLLAASFSLSCLRTFARASLRSSFWNGKGLVRWTRHTRPHSHLLGILFFLLSNENQH